MKKYLFVICFLTIMGAGAFVQAQMQRSSVSVIVSPNHSDWKYKAGEEATFTVQVYCCCVNI